MVEFSPATREARVRFPANALLLRGQSLALLSVDLASLARVTYIGNVKWYSRSEKEFVSFFKKVNMCSTYNSSTALWAFIPESENLYHKKTYA